MTRASWWFRVLAAGARLQLSQALQAQLLLGAVISPLAASIYILMARHLGRDDLSAYVVIAPILTAVWGTAITSSGEAISEERSRGTLELLIAAPAPVALVIVGRLVATTALSLVSAPLTLALGWLMGMTLPVRAPLLFLLGASGLLLCTVGLGLILASTFVLARSTRLFQNVIGFPLFILGGAAFPIALLPDAVQPLSAVVALSWAAELMRASVSRPGQDVTGPLIAIVVLAAAYAVVGGALLKCVLWRVRGAGTLSSY
jgi:ABC-2 type transport system permease protein